jgi:hypothetical protein
MLLTEAPCLERIVLTAATAIIGIALFAHGGGVFLKKYSTHEYYFTKCKNDWRRFGDDWFNWCRIGASAGVTRRS